jgi:predicted Zn-dependent peptidase
LVYFTISCGIDAAKEEIVIREVEAIIRSYQEGTIDPSLLYMAKEMIISQLRESVDQPLDLFEQALRMDLINYPTAAEYIKRIEAITMEEVQAVSRKNQSECDLFLKGVNHETNNYSFLQETVYQSTLPNGLSLVVIPKRGYAKVYSIFATKFGSYSSRFSTNGEEFSLPLGLAHFLEHQLFESDGDVDITNQFALLGAECNAFTNYQETAYITSSSTKNEEVISLLLDYVQNPHFTAESIQEEQGIIEQERVMYLDKPGVRVHMGLLKNLYFNHPVREDIVGTKESIVAINEADMRKAYETFYHPSNMMLVIVGDVNPNDMEQLVVANQHKKAFIPRVIPRTIIPDEPLEVVRLVGEEVMDIKMPKAVVGLKLPPLPRFNHSMIEVEAMLRIIQEYYFGASSRLYQELIDSELFSTSYLIIFSSIKPVGIFISVPTPKNQRNCGKD